MVGIGGVAEMWNQSDGQVAGQTTNKNKEGGGKNFEGSRGKGG